MTDLKERFGNRLASARKRRNLTQEALATTSGLSVDTIKRLETSRIGASFDVVARLSEALEVDPSVLFEPDQPTKPREVLVRLTDDLSSMSDRELEWIRTVIVELRKRP